MNSSSFCVTSSSVIKTGSLVMYLSDVTGKNGNFQFITNSSRKHIGYPKPRTENYNTRFADDTIEQLLKQKKNIKHDIIGKKEQ